MIRSITKQKPEQELDALLKGANRVFIIGCGTCTTLTRTGGEPEVAAMAESLQKKGKMITGRMVAPVACDNLTAELYEEHGRHIKQADVLLVMNCAFGVQTVATQTGKWTVPAQDTIFLGKETGIGRYDEICTQCGTCIIGETGGVCPVTACHKGMVNGPCGGTNNGKCEIDSEKDCAWTVIYNRLLKLDRLDSMKKYQKPRNHLGEPSPGKFHIPVEE